MDFGKNIPVYKSILKFSDPLKDVLDVQWQVLMSKIKEIFKKKEERRAKLERCLDFIVECLKGR